MKKLFTVTVRREVVETATFEVEAESPTEARIKADDQLEDITNDCWLDFEFSYTDVDPEISDISQTGLL